MVRRLLGLLIALAIVFALPTLGGGIPTMHGMAATADCACASAESDCGEQDKPDCGGAMACAVQCSVATPMLGGELGAAGGGANGASHVTAPAAPLISISAVPPLRPPTHSIRA